MHSKISIIMVCYNSASTIRRALESIKIQTYKPIELIVVDGQSTDNTLSIVNEFLGIHKLVISEKDNGIYDAMNKGVTLSTGEVIFFLNSDDAFSDAKVVEDAMAMFTGNPAIDMLYGDVLMRFPDKDQYRTYKNVSKKNILHTGICHQAVFSRKALFAECGLFNTNYKINADFDWLIRVFRSSKNCRYFPRLISIFYAGGAHMNDIGFSWNERRRVQLQYDNGLSFWFGHYKVRCVYHLRRLFLDVA